MTTKKLKRVIIEDVYDDDELLLPGGGSRTVKGALTGSMVSRGSFGPGDDEDPVTNLGIY